MINMGSGGTGFRVWPKLNAKILLHESRAERKILGIRLDANSPQFQSVTITSVVDFRGIPLSWMWFFR